MFDINTEDTDLEEAIASAYRDLKSFSADEEGYQKAVDQLSKLYALQHQTAQLNLQAQTASAAHQLADSQHQLAEDQHKLACSQVVWQEEQDARPFYMRISPDTALTVAGNLAVALIVIKFEQQNVISTKLMNFMKKI